MRAAIFPLLSITMLAGCVSDIVGRDATTNDPLAAPGPAARAADIVDPFIVGDRLLAAGEAELALDSYLRAAARDGMTPDVKLAMANANIELGRLYQAERLLRDVVEAQPQNARAMNNLAVVLLELGETGEAHRLFRTAFALQPSPEIRDNLRVAAAKFEKPSYDDVDENNAFTLTRRADGTFGLYGPGSL
ncbi:MAG: tetratricopeptide repeat protein [Pseudomonadota bacterium]